MAKVSWESVQWPDGGSYEGLVKDERCHVRGVFNYPDGARYMGEYVDNRMEGYGVYVWGDGTVYRGEWKDSMAHGCGVKISKQPNGQFIAEEGKFVNDEWVGDVMGCSVGDARRAAAEADTAAAMAAAFQLGTVATPVATDKINVTDVQSGKARSHAGPLGGLKGIFDNVASKVFQKHT